MPDYLKAHVHFISRFRRGLLGSTLLDELPERWHSVKRTLSVRKIEKMGQLQHNFGMNKYLSTFKVFRPWHCIWNIYKASVCFQVLYIKEIYVNKIVSKEEIFTLYPYFFLYNVMQGLSPIPTHNGKQNIILNCSAIWCDKLVMSCESVSFPLFPWGAMLACLACDMPHTNYQCGRSPAFWNTRLSIILGW